MGYCKKCWEKMSKVSWIQRCYTMWTGHVGFNFKEGMEESVWEDNVWARFKGGREVGYVLIWEGIFLAEGTANTKILRHEHAWYCWELQRGQCGPGIVSERKEKRSCRSVCSDSGCILRELWEKWDDII